MNVNDYNDFDANPLTQFKSIIRMTMRLNVFIEFDEFNDLIDDFNDLNCH